MKNCRVELRLYPNDPLWTLLGELPGRQRNALARAILEAALLPGGWARIPGVPGLVGGPLVESEPPRFEETPEEAVSVGTGMSAAGAQGFLAGLRKFEALDDD